MDRPMSKHHFLANATVRPAISPSERWLLAFPQGQWSNWATLLATVKPQDTVWVSTQHADWEAKVAAVVRQRPQSPVVVVSSTPQDAEGLRAINAGAKGYCHLMAVPAMLNEVAQVVEHGGLWLGPDLVQRLMAATRDVLARSPNAQVPSANVSALSERELQVARAVADGHTNKEVADLLHISERTVKAHLGAVFEKLGVRDRLQLVLRLARQPQ
jgi:two-component system, NarL family, nitrate/nitrite response regulator NarL